MKTNDTPTGWRLCDEGVVRYWVRDDCAPVLVRCFNIKGAWGPFESFRRLDGQAAHVQAHGTLAEAIARCERLLLEHERKAQLRPVA